jgi:phosphoglycerate dehydrogenase-like enzyme
VKILVTCPPMLRQIDRFKDEFAQLEWAVTTPDIVQVMDESSLTELVPQHDGWIIGDDPATDAVLSAGAAGKLRAGVRWGIGVDNVDFDAAKRLGLPIRNTPGVFGAEVADLAMHYLTGLARRTYEIDRGVRAGQWPKPAGASLAGKGVALAGFGDIGRQFARRAHAANMKLFIYDPAVKDANAVNPHQLRHWPDGLAECDYVVLTCALTPTSRRMVNAETLSLLPGHAMLINVARGGLVDEQALIEALSSRRLAGAALEVFETEPPIIQSPLLRHPNCILGSHNASNTIEAVDRASRRAISILDELLSNENQ